MKSYPKTTVSIFFSFVIAASLTSFSSRAQMQDRKLLEPEKLGVIYSLNLAANSLDPLERQTASVKSSGYFKLKAKVAAQLKGEKASLRLKPHHTPEFVVQLANGVDPSKYKLYSFDVKKEKREVVIAKATLLGATLSPGTVAFDVTKYGQSSYKFVPSQQLPQGEYGFSSDDSNEVFCFGVDAPE